MGQARAWVMQEHACLGSSKGVGHAGACLPWVMQGRGSCRSMPAMGYARGWVMQEHACHGSCKGVGHAGACLPWVKQGGGSSRSMCTIRPQLICWAGQGKGLTWAHAGGWLVRQGSAMGALMCCSGSTQQGVAVVPGQLNERGPPILLGAEGCQNASRSFRLQAAAPHGPRQATHSPTQTRTHAHTHTLPSASHPPHAVVLAVCA